VGAIRDDDNRQVREILPRNRYQRKKVKHAESKNVPKRKFIGSRLVASQSLIDQ